MSKLKRFFGLKDKEERDVTSVNFSDALTFFNLQNKYSAMNCSAFFGATELISNSVAMLPLKVLVKNKEGKNELENHPLNLIFSDRECDNLLSRFTLLKQIVQSVILRGDAFCYIQRASDGSVLGLRYLEASDVITYYSKEKDLLFYDIPILKKKRVEYCDMLHFLLHSYNGINGVSLLTYAARTLNITNASENSAKNFFSNGMNVNGLLKVNTPISQKQKDEIRASWNQAYSGNGGLAVINGNMEYTQLQLSPEDSQLLSSRQFNVSDIARFFNLNPVLLGGESSASYSSLEMLQNSFLVHTLQPYISMLESELNRKLLKPSESNLEIILETNEILRIDKSSQANYYKTMIDSGVLSRNEVRKELGYSAIEGGDRITVAYSDIDQNTVNKDTNNNDKNQEEEDEQNLQ